MSMTIQEAINQLDGAKVLLLNRKDFVFNEAIIMAITALREKAEREDPKPLTLEELRHMDGEPVYIVYASAQPCEWVVFDHHNDDGFGTSDNSWWFAKCYGKFWEAYRHKPKEG